MKRINMYSVRMVKESGKLYDMEDTLLHSPDTAAEAANKVFGFQYLPREIFTIFTLNTKNKIAGAHILFQGSLNASIVHPREVFQAALLNNAASVLCFHNHPSGDPSPSREDIAITQRLVECGKMLGIEVLDHIIIGDQGFISLKEKGYA